MTVLVSYGTELNQIGMGNLAYEVGEKLSHRFRYNEDVVFVSYPVTGDTFKFNPPKDLQKKIKEIKLASNEAIIDIYSTSIWDAIGEKYEPWKGKGSPPEFLIEMPQNAAGKTLITREEKLERGIITSHLNTIGEFSYKDFIKKLPLKNYYPVFISFNEEEIDKDKNRAVRKDLLTHELEKLIIGL